MAEPKDRAGTAMVAGGSAALGVALALLLTRKAEAAPPSDEAVLALLQSIAQSGVGIDTDLDTLITELSKLSINVKGWPPNAESILSFTVLCAVAATPYQASDMEIPDGMALAIKASPLNAIGSLVFVAKTPAECTNPNSSWPLIPNEAITYLVKNTKTIYVSSNIAGSIAIFTTEKRS